MNERPEKSKDEDVVAKPGLSAEDFNLVAKKFAEFAGQREDLQNEGIKRLATDMALDELGIKVAEDEELLDELKLEDPEGYEAEKG